MQDSRTTQGNCVARTRVAATRTTVSVGLPQTDYNPPIPAAAPTLPEPPCST